MKVWHAPAKLNLFLHVAGRRSNGYHEVQTVFQLVDWSDHLSFEQRTDGLIERIPEIPCLSNSNDLAVKAAKKLQEISNTKLGVRIYLEKKIPIGSGLGGGSSDAATTLIALNKYWQLDLSTEELSQIGSSIGADVAVFVNGFTAWGEGIGDELTPIEIPECYYVIVVPPIQVSTHRVYENANFTRFRNRIKNRDRLPDKLANDLEETACKLYPQVGDALQWLRQFGPARMSGSGGAVFLEVENQPCGEDILAELPDNYTGQVCKGISSCSEYFG